MLVKIVKKLKNLITASGIGVRRFSIIKMNWVITANQQIKAKNRAKFFFMMLCTFYLAAKVFEIG